jgi:DNA-binding GntR family transcriptional regulator
MTKMQRSGADGLHDNVSQPVNEVNGDKANNTLKAYREIRRRIFENEMPAGAQFLEQQLAELLNMSRTPVREALIRLEEERLVEVKPRHGVRILPVLPDDMREIYDLLAELEAVAARRAAERGLTETQLKALEVTTVDMAAALAAGDMKAWSRADEQFHQLMTQAAGNSRMVQVVNMLIDQSQSVRMKILDSRPPPKDSNDDHMAVLDAVKRRDPEAAFKIQHAHRQRAGRLLTALLVQSTGGH